MHHRRMTVAAISAIGVALACSQDRITSSDTTATQGGVVPLVTIGEPPAIQAFDIGVSFQGSLKPGAPIVITVRAQANVDAPDAELVVATPELETVKLRAVQGGPFPLSIPLPLQAGFKGGVVVGQVVTRSFTVTAPLAGYYSVQIEAKVRGVPQRAGRPVEDVVRAERWMLIDERGGRITDRFDMQALPDTVTPTIGPRRLKGRASSRLAPTRTPMSPGDCDVWVVVWYYAPNQYQPVAGATAEWTVTEDQTGAEVGNGNWTTDATGEVWVCNPPGYGYSGHIGLQSSTVTINHWVGQFGGGATNGDTLQAPINSWAMAAFLTLQYDIPRTQAIFGFSRPGIHVSIGPCPGSNPPISCYQHGGWPPADNIYLNAVLGDYGGFTTVHEYGHAFHEKALGGITGSCSGSHNLGSPSTLGCAYSEGIADLISFVVRGESTTVAQLYSDDRIEQNYYFNEWGASNPDGSVDEAAVAAFLYDLLDDTSYPDGPANETGVDDDNVAYPASYVASVIRTCNVREGDLWEHSNGVDHLTYCFERQIDATVTGSSTYFPQRSVDPVAFMEGATEPGSWSQSAIRGQWVLDLYRGLGLFTTAMARPAR